MELERQQQEKRPCLIAAAAYVGMVAVNILSEALPINGVTAGQVSARYPTLITPASGTFLIWGGIYALLLLYTLYQCGVFQWGEGRGACATELTRAIAPFFTLSCVCNASWLIAWHYNLVLVCFLLLVGLTYCLTRIMCILCRERLCMKEKLFIFLPFSIYFAWSIVASIINAAVLLISVHWNGWGITPQMWAVIVLSIGALLAIYLMFRCKASAIGLVFVWAYGGILVFHTSPEGWNGAYPLVILALVICLIALLFSFALNIYRKK